MNVLVIKLNATGDVVRTTPLLRRFHGTVTWLTAQTNTVLLDGVSKNLTRVPWEQRSSVLESMYDLVINLEDEATTAAFASSVRHHQLFGAYMGRHEQVQYTDDARRWFDMSLVSAYGKEKADALKFANRHSYQELIFDGLGLRFDGEPYVLPEARGTSLAGDVAIAPNAGPGWPMKTWAHYDRLKDALESRGLRVNVLPHRPSLLEHLGDIKGHRCLVSGDSLPMHLALGVGTPCVTLFNCTSPWEIHDYGTQIKIVSPLLETFFYKRDFDRRATSAIDPEAVLGAVMEQLGRTGL